MVAEPLDFVTMAGLVFMRHWSRTVLSTCIAKATRFRGSNRCYRTAFGRTAAVLTVNNNRLSLTAFVTSLSFYINLVVGRTRLLMINAAFR